MPTRPKSPRKNIYSVHPSVLKVRTWIEEMPRRTGRSLEEWLALIESDGPADESERADWLKRTHSLSTSVAAWMAERAAGKGLEDSDPQAYLAAAAGYVEAMYGGAKAALRPLHDRLVTLARRLGRDVKVCPCKTIVPLYREHVFAEIKPATRTRIDLGLALGDLKAERRLIDTGGFAKRDRITHRISLLRLADIDLEVERWLRKAYEMDAPAPPLA